MPQNNSVIMSISSQLLHTDGTFVKRQVPEVPIDPQMKSLFRAVSVDYADCATGARLNDQLTEKMRRQKSFDALSRTITSDTRSLHSGLAYVDLPFDCYGLSFRDNSSSVVPSMEGCVNHDGCCYCNHFSTFLQLTDDVARNILKPEPFSQRVVREYFQWYHTWFAAITVLPLIMAVDLCSRYGLSNLRFVLRSSNGSICLS